MKLNEVDWTIAEDRLDCRADQVHVWLASLARSEAELNRLRQTLSQSERDRCTRLARSTDHDWFTAAHGILRDILSRYLGTKPACLTFSSGTHGKPALAREGGATADLRFNLSHSNGYALYAVTLNREVGIDLEYLLRPVDGVALARRFFSRQECDALALLPGESKTRRFFEYWTCREAFVKARGTGLRFPLNELQVILPTHGAGATVQHPSTDLEASRCFLYPFAPLQDFVGALAIEGADLPVKWWRWEPAHRGDR